MAKSRVIIADLDSSYIIPLQAKFAEDFYNQVEIDIITEPEYFKSFFAKPQKAELLIVSEGLYNEHLQMHHIGKIFLMTERDQKVEENELNVVRLFKYTSIKEIFSEIIGECQELLKVQVSQKETKVVIVTSACGGMGKTTIAMGICHSLAQKRKRVLYIDAEEFQVFQSMLENAEPITASTTFSGMARMDGKLYENIRNIICTEEFDYLPPFKAPLMSFGIQLSVYIQIIKALKESEAYDFVVVDTDAVLNEEKALLMSEADHVLIVTKQTAHAAYATTKLTEQISGVANEKYCFICNDFKKDEENLLAADMGVNFTVSYYVEHCIGFGCVKDYIKMPDIQKVAFLLL